MLKYLVLASIEGKNPKEYTIGVELFGKKYEDENKSDSNIRVYIHNVRKKLRDYYDDEGSKDQVVFEIDRGKYHVSFKSRKEYTGKKNRSYFIPFLATLMLFLITFFLFILKEKEAKPVWQDLPVWQEFADNDLKTLLVLGDYYVFQGMLPTGKMGIYRDFSINSEIEYEHLLDKKPELVKLLSKSNLTYLSKMAAFCESDIYQVFAQTGGEIEVKLLSDVQPTDLKNYNIILVSNFKNMGIFESIIQKMNFSFGISNTSIQYIISNDPCAQIYEARNDNLKEEDYALVIHAGGYGNNRYLFFLSSQDIGNISTVKQFTQPEYMRHFREEYLKQINSDDFKALYQVEGINKTDLSFELIRFE